MSDLDNAPEDFALMDLFTQNEILANAVVAVQTRAFNQGRQEGWKTANLVHKQQRSMQPFLLIVIAMFTGMVGGAVLWGTFARSGWIDIIGACLP